MGKAVSELEMADLKAARASQEVVMQKPDSELTFEEKMLKYPKPPELEQDKNDDNLEERAGLWSTLTFSFMEPLIALGYRRPLTERDIPSTCKDNSALIAAPELEREWERVRAEHLQSKRKAVAKARAKGLPASSVKETQPSLSSAVLSTLGGYAVLLVALQLLMRVEQTFEPIILEKILKWLGNPIEEEKWGYIYGAILVVMAFAQQILNNLFFHRGFKIYTRVRSAVCALVYTKAMKVAILEQKPKDKNQPGDAKPGSNSENSIKNSQGDTNANENSNGRQGPPGGKKGAEAGADMSSGQIVNLMSVDADKIGMMFIFGWSALFVPIQIAVSLYLLYDTIGYSMFAGFGVIFIMLPIVAFCVFTTMRSTQGRMTISDRRIKLTNEILQGIRIVKFYAWEYFFQKELGQVRDAEVNHIFRTNLFAGMTMFVFTLMVNLFSVAVFVVYSYVTEDFNAAKIFKAAAYVNSLQAPLFQLPNAISTILMGLISARRVQNFLLQPEVDSMKRITATQPIAFRKHQRALLEEDAKARGIELPYDAVAATEIPGLDMSTYDPNRLTDHDSLQEPKDPANDVELENCTFTWKSVTKEIGDGLEDEMISSQAGSSDNVVVTVEQDDFAVGSIPRYLQNLTPSQKAKLRKIPAVLKNIDFKAMRGKLTAIIGPVGSGKSSLLAGILGEIDIVHGGVARRKDAKLAYVAQSAWIQTRSIRENITFGEAIDTSDKQLRYERTLDVCALRPDLAVFDAGDATEIGDRGVNLSGGQKQRIAIARAVYANADIYFFDDPLSAVDAHVAEHIFEQCIEGELSGKTRILVMNQLHFLPRCDYIYVLGTTIERRRDLETNQINPTMNDQGEATESKESKEATVGIIAEHGTYAQLNESGEQFKALMQNYRESLEKRVEETEEVPFDEVELQTIPTNVDDVVLGTEDIGPADTEEAKMSGPVVVHGPDSDGQLQRKASYNDPEGQSVVRSRAKVGERSISYSVSRSRSLSASRSRKEVLEAKNQHGVTYIGGGALRKGQQIQDEELVTGHVSAALYVRFFKAMGKSNVFLLLATACIAQTAMTWLGLMLGYWADGKWSKTHKWYREMYLIIMCICIFFMFLRSWFFAKGTARASGYFHGDMLDRILRANSNFFDITPAGRILNRFSKDLDAIDTLIPQTLLHVLSLALSLLATMITCACLYPWFTIALVVIVVAFYFFQGYYSPAAIQVQRIESNTRSPLFQHFSESIKGIATIRAFNRVPQFQIENFAKIDANSAALYWVRMIYRWGGLRVGMLQTLLIFSAVLIVVTTKGDLDVGMSGVVLTYMLSISGLVGFIVMMWIELSGRMNSVERLLHYTENVPLEASLDNGVNDFRPPEAWPSKGVVEYRNVQMRYRPDLPPILHDINFLVEAGKKVGVVGRTGSGKSSLMMLLLRLYELEKGQIFIDGIDISQLALHDLRKHIGIVPQDPVMFSGTLRSNLDPFNQYSDEEIMDSLAAVNLDGYVKRLPQQLQSPVLEFGSNFSQGQRQLICLCRVLLKKPKILLLDEATSSVDSETDALLQRAIQERFTETTQLTIAHRLNTVMNSDRILVLDKGHLMEYDSPSELIKDPSPESKSQPRTLTRVPGIGIFADMYKAYLQQN